VHAAMQMCKSSVYAVNIGYHPLCMSIMQMHASNTNCWFVDPLKIYPGQGGPEPTMAPKRLRQ
jgi:hypothetical protein